jgi:signal recognition particle receptor subunit alpha
MPCHVYSTFANHVQAVYQSLLHISWIDQLLENIRALFSELYKTQLSQKNTTKFTFPFDPYFDRQIQQLEKSDSISHPVVKVSAPVESSPDLSAEETAPSDFEKPVSRKIHHVSEGSRPSSPAQHLLTGKGGPRGSRRSRKQATGSINGFPVSSGDESTGRKAKGPTKGKKMRNWGADGFEDDGEDVALDFSNTNQDDSNPRQTMEAVDQASWGSTTADGHFMLKDIGEEMNEILGAAQEKKAESQKPTGVVGSSLSTISGLFKNVVGGKTLTPADLEKPLKGMEDHLLKKNVAREAAVRLCDTLEKDLIGTKTSNFTSKLNPSQSHRMHTNRP